MDEKIKTELEKDSKRQNLEEKENKDLNIELENNSDNDSDNEVKKTDENTEEQKNKENENFDSIKKELEETKDKLLRSLAENENTRKQMEKIRIETNKYGVQPLAREILNVVDNFDRALSLKNDNNEKALAEGLTLIQKEVLSILERFNVKKIEALGEDFNANYHQAMFEKSTDDFKEGQVCEIVQDGYTFHDRLLRPVLAGVAKKGEENTNLEKSSNKNLNDKEND